METPYSTPQTYIEDFNSVNYLQTYYAQGQGTLVGEWTDFVLQNLHELFTPGCVEGDTLIDFGAGPTIYHLLSACEVFNNIITSDFLEQNRRQLQKWLRKVPDAFDWTPIVKYVCELENNRDNVEEKQEKLRRKVRKVLQCDALKKNPYDPVVMPEADCLLSCLCLEAPCKDPEAFCNTLKSFYDLLKPGGHIIVLSVLKCTFYFVGQKKFSCLFLTREDVERAFERAGYEIQKIKVVPRNDKSGMDVTDYHSLYCVHARKPLNLKA